MESILFVAVLAVLQISTQGIHYLTLTFTFNIEVKWHGRYCVSSKEYQLNQFSSPLMA